MKELSIYEMEYIEGGKECSTLSTIGGVLTLGALGLGVGAVMVTNPWLAAGLLSAKYSVMIADGGVAIAAIIACTSS